MPKYIVTVKWEVETDHEVEADNPEEAKLAIGDKLDRRKLLLSHLMEEEAANIKYNMWQNASIDHVEEG